MRRSLGDRADHAARIACGEDAIRDVPGHHAAGSHDGSRSDPYPGEDDRSAAHHTSDPISIGLSNARGVVARR
jgi:hypothetical protein